MLVFVVFCGICNTSLYISNHSGSAWYVAVTSNGGMHSVARVADGADRLAFDRMGGVDIPVSVLDSSGNRSVPSSAKLLARTLSRQLLASPPGSRAMCPDRSTETNETYN